MVVDDSAAQSHLGSAQVFLRNILSGGFFHHRWSRGEDGSSGAHDAEVAHRSDECAVARGRAEDGRDGGYLARAPCLRDQVGGAAPVVLSAWPESGAFQQHDQGNLVAQRQFCCQTVAFRVASGADSAGQGGEVLGPDHHRCAAIMPGAGDDAVGGDLTPDQRAELLEAAGVEQVIDAGAGIEFSRPAVLGQPLSPPMACACWRRRCRSCSVSCQSCALLIEVSSSHCAR